MARRVRPKASSPFSKSGLPAVDHVVEVDRTLDHDLLVAFESLEYLVVAAILQADSDGALSEVTSILRNPDRHAAVALAYHAVERYRDRCHRRPRDDQERCEHAW